MLWSDLDIASWDFKRVPTVQTVITKQNLQVLHVPAGTSVLPVAFSMQLEDAIQVWDLSSLLEQNPEKRSENLQKLRQDYQRLKERWLVQYERYTETQQATLLGQMQEQGIFPAVSAKRFGAELHIEPAEQERLLLLLRYASRTIIGEQGTPQDLNRVLHQLQQQTTAVVPFKHVTVPPPPPVPDILEKAYKAVQSLALPAFIDIPDSVLTKFQQFTLRLQAGRSSMGYIVKYLAAANMLSTLTKTNKSMLERYELLDLPAIDESYLLTFALADNIPQTSTYSVHKSWNDAFRTAAASTADLSAFKEVSLDQLAQHLQKAKEATAEPIKVPLHADATGVIYLWLVPKRLDSYAYSSSIGWRPAAGWLSANSAIQVYPALNFVLQGHTTNTLGRFPQVSTGVPQHNSYWCYASSLLMHKFNNPEVTTKNTWWQSTVPEDISMPFVNYYVGPVHLRADVQASYKPYGKSPISQKGAITKTFTPIQVSVQNTVVVNSAQLFAYIRQSLGWAAMGSVYTQVLDYATGQYQVLFQHNSTGVGVDSSTHLIAWQDYKGKRTQDFPDNYDVKYLGGAVSGLITASLSAEEVEEQYGWYKYALNLIKWKDPVQHLEPQPDAHTVVSEVKLPCTPTIQTQALQLVPEMYTKSFVLKPVPTYETLKGIWDALTPQHYAQLVAGVGNLKDIEGNYTY